MSSPQNLKRLKQANAGLICSSLLLALGNITSLAFQFKVTSDTTTLLLFPFATMTYALVLGTHFFTETYYHRITMPQYRRKLLTRITRLDMAYNRSFLTPVEAIDLLKQRYQTDLLQITVSGGGCIALLVFGLLGKDSFSFIFFYMALPIFILGGRLVVVTLLHREKLRKLCSGPSGSPLHDKSILSGDYYMGGYHGPPERGRILFARSFLTVAVVYIIIIFASNVMISPFKGGLSVKFIPYDNVNWDEYRRGWTVSIVFKPQPSEDISQDTFAEVTLLGVSMVDASCLRSNSTAPELTFDCGPYNSTIQPLEDVIIQVNFTALPEDCTAYVFAGLTNNTADIYSNTEPIPLQPNQHLMGHVMTHARVVYKNRGLAKMGYGQSSRTYPFTTISSLVPKAILPDQIVGTGTLQLRTLDDIVPGRTSMFLTDDQEKTLLGGIASVGGLWTSLAGVFAILFGGTFAYNLFGTKPLSTFGLIHMSEKGRMRRKGRFPDLSSPLAKFLNNHFIDIRPDEPDGTDDEPVDSDASIATSQLRRDNDESERKFREVMSRLRQEGSQFAAELLLSNNAHETESRRTSLSTRGHSHRESSD